MKKAIVIGGGVGGLAVANMLAKSGYRVMVLEKNNQLGGRMRQLKKKGFTFDTGPSWYLMPEVFEHYFALFGRKTTDYYALQRLSPAYKVFFDYAKPVLVRGKLTRDMSMFESLESGAGEKLEQYVADAKHIYTMALRYFLYNPFRSWGQLLANREVVTNSPKLLTGLTGSLHRHVARRFSSKQLQQILEYAMVFLGTSPFEAPSLYRLMSYLDFEQGVFFPKGGMYKVTEAFTTLGKELGVKYKLNTPVDRIIVRDGRATGVKVGATTYEADVVVSNADLAFTETKLLSSVHQTYPRAYWEKKKPAPAGLVMYLGIKGSLPELQHHNLFFVDAWKQNFNEIYRSKEWPRTASMYVSKTTASDASVAPKGHENIFVLVPLPAGKKMTRIQEQKLADRYLEQLETQSGIADFRARIVTREVLGPEHFASAFHAWQGSALGLNHTLRQSAFMRPSVQSKKVKNLYYVGGMTQPGIGVPMCLISAELVIKAMTGDASAGPLPNLPEIL